MFVSEPPVTQPTRYNYTFMSLNLGADTITIQADDPKKRCTPKPSQNKYCDFYVGVSGWSRTAVFSIVAKLDSSYYDTSTTIHLKEGRPQTSTVEIGRYAYFFYKVPANTVEATTIISVTVRTSTYCSLSALIVFHETVYPPTSFLAVRPHRCRSVRGSDWRTRQGSLRLRLHPMGQRRRPSVPYM